MKKVWVSITNDTPVTSTTFPTDITEPSGNKYGLCYTFLSNLRLLVLSKALSKLLWLGTSPGIPEKSPPPSFNIAKTTTLTA